MESKMNVIFSLLLIIGTTLAAPAPAPKPDVLVAPYTPTAYSTQVFARNYNGVAAAPLVAAPAVAPYAAAPLVASPYAAYPAYAPYVAYV